MYKSNIICAFILLCAALCACSGAPKRVPAPKDSCLKAIVRPQPAEDKAVLLSRVKKAEALMADMSTEDKVGQLFIVGIGGLNGEQSPEVFPTAVNEKQLGNIKNYHLGGVIFYGGNVINDAQIKKYIAGLQSAAQIPLFISIDEEGGLVSRLGNNQDISVDKFPPMIEIGNGGDSQKAFDAGATLGRQMRALGFNLDFAPVADVLTNPLNTVIRQKGRAFGIEPEIVCHMVPRFVEGMQEQGVSAVLKHFPGHGDTVADSHEERVWSYADGERLRTVELLPFRAGIQAGVDFVMAAHVSLPRLTGGDEPASMSKYLITDLLKGELGFKGVVITDDMYMDAVRKHYDAASAAVNSINAGIDMIIIKLFFEDAYNGVLDAVKAGKISEARLDDAVRKTLELKIKRGVIN